MTDQVADTLTLIPCAPKEKSTGSEADVMDQAANAILVAMVHVERAVSIQPYQKSRYARRDDRRGASMGTCYGHQ